MDPGRAKVGSEDEEVIKIKRVAQTWLRQNLRWPILNFDDHSRIPAEGLEDEKPGVFDEVIETSDEEEVVDDDRLALAQLRLCGVEVEGDVQTLDEFCGRKSRTL